MDAASPPAQLSQANWHALHCSWSTWLQAIHTGAPDISSFIVIIVECPPLQKSSKVTALDIVKEWSSPQIVA